MKTLILYYSYTGNVKLMAEKMAEAIGADIARIQTKENIDLKGLKKFIWLGKQVLIKEEPEILPIDKNLDDYDLIIFGSPVWAWSFTPALLTFFKSIQLKNKKIGLFCCHGGGKGAIFRKMRDALGDNNYVGEIDFFEPLQKETDEKIKNAIEWAQKITQ